jgi:hypothetical protein
MIYFSYKGGYAHNQVYKRMVSCLVKRNEITYIPLLVRKQLRLFVSTFIVGILIGASSMVALAAYGESNYGYYGPVGGYSYKNQATINSSGSSVTASTIVSETGLNNVPANYMGVQPRIFQNGTFCASYPMNYNSTAANGMGTPINHNCVQLLLLIRGEKEMLFRSTAVRIVLVCSVFSVGIAVGTISISSTLAKNTTPNTVYVDKEQTQPRKEKIPNYPKNANGQTYGSGMEASSLETEPDLMRAYGADGTIVAPVHLLEPFAFHFHF